MIEVMFLAHEGVTTEMMRFTIYTIGTLCLVNGSEYFRKLFLIFIIIFHC